MQHVIKYAPTFSLLQVQLMPNEVLIAEAGAMVARASAVKMDVKMNAGRNAGFFGKLKAFFIALIRKIVGGETFFVNHFSCDQPGGWVWLAPSLSGGIQHIAMQGQSMMFSTGAFLACAGEVDMRMRFGGCRAILAKEGAFFIEMSGTGDLWVNSYGGISEVMCNGTYIVDNGHIVGFDSALTFTIRRAGAGCMALFASGEGLVCEFKGQGRILIQSRNLGALVDWLKPMLPS